MLFKSSRKQESSTTVHFESGAALTFQGLLFSNFLVYLRLNGTFVSHLHMQLDT